MRTAGYKKIHSLVFFVYTIRTYERLTTHGICSLIDAIADTVRFYETQTQPSITPIKTSCSSKMRLEGTANTHFLSFSFTPSHLLFYNSANDFGYKMLRLFLWSE